MATKDSAEISDFNKRPICTFYLLSSCTKGQKCPFLHDIPNELHNTGSKTTGRDLCFFYLKGICNEGNSCSRSHSDPPCLNGTIKKICLYFSKGNCERGKLCSYIHEQPDYLPPVNITADAQASNAISQMVINTSDDVQSMTDAPKPCRFYRRGMCFFGDQCTSFHDKPEMDPETYLSNLRDKEALGVSNSLDQINSHKGEHSFDRTRVLTKTEEIYFESLAVSEQNSITSDQSDDNKILPHRVSNPSRSKDFLRTPHGNSSNTKELFRIGNSEKLDTSFNCTYLISKESSRKVNNSSKTKESLADSLIKSSRELKSSKLLKISVEDLNSTSESEEYLKDSVRKPNNAKLVDESVSDQNSSSMSNECIRNLNSSSKFKRFVQDSRSSSNAKESVTNLNFSSKIKEFSRNTYSSSNSKQPSNVEKYSISYSKSREFVKVPCSFSSSKEFSKSRYSYSNSKKFPNIPIKEFSRASCSSKNRTFFSFRRADSLTKELSRGAYVPLKSKTFYRNADNSLNLEQFPINADDLRPKDTKELFNDRYNQPFSKEQSKIVCNSKSELSVTGEFGEQTGTKVYRSMTRKQSKSQRKPKKVLVEKLVKCENIRANLFF